MKYTFPATSLAIPFGTTGISTAIAGVAGGEPPATVEMEYCEGWACATTAAPRQKKATRISLIAQSLWQTIISLRVIAANRVSSHLCSYHLDTTDAPDCPCCMREQSSHE